MNGISGLELSVSLTQLSALKHFSVRLFMCLKKERREEKKGEREKEGSSLDLPRL